MLRLKQQIQAVIRKLARKEEAEQRERMKVLAAIRAEAIALQKAEVQATREVLSNINVE